MATVKGCSVHGFKVGFSFPAEANIDFENCQSYGSEVGFFAYDSPETLKLMLNSLNDHQKEFDELKKKVEELTSKNPRILKRIIKASTIAAMLSSTSDLTTVIEFLLSRLRDAKII